MNKVSLNISFNTELSQDDVALLVADLKKNFFSCHEVFDCHADFTFDSCVKGRVRIFEISLEEFFDSLVIGKKSFSYGGNDYLVKMNSQRYFMFKENSCCVCCGLRGTRMFLEYHPYDMIPHFNLYGEVEGKLILMTKDHILAKALGGEDRHSNYQTMCSVCNSLKGHTSLTLESLKTLRRFFDEKQSKMTRKQIHCLLEECKKQLEKKEKRIKVKENSLCFVLNCDVACFVDEKGGIYGRHIYEKANDKRVGCMKKGTRLLPILEYKGEIICSISNKESIRLLKKDLSSH